MSIVSALAIYFVIWWLVLFAVLPFGVTSQQEAGNVTPGTEQGAPSDPKLVRKLCATTIVAAFIFAGVYLYFGVFGKTLADLVL